MKSILSILLLLLIISAQGQQFQRVKLNDSTYVYSLQDTIRLPVVRIRDTVYLPAPVPTPEDPQPQPVEYNGFVSTTGVDQGDCRTSPCKTIRYAVSRANKIKVSAGVYVEQGPVTLSDVHIEGENGVVIKAQPSFHHQSHPGVPSRSLIQVRNNTILKNVTVDGDGKKLNGGIYITGTNNYLESITVLNCFFSGIWMDGVTNARLSKLFLQNSGNGSSWSSGNICIGAVDGVEIDNFEIREESGYGIKAYPSFKIQRNLKIHDFTITVAPLGSWVNPQNNSRAPNIAIEFHNTVLNDGCEIYNGRLDNYISIVPKTGTSGTLKIYNITSDILTRANGNSASVELSRNDVEIYNCYFTGGYAGIINWDRSVVITGWNIHHNTFDRMSWRSWAAACVMTNSRASGVFNDNTVQFDGPNSGAYYLFRGDNNSAGSSFTGTRNLVINTNNRGQISNGGVSVSFPSNQFGTTAPISRQGARPLPYYETAVGYKFGAFQR